MKLNVLTPEKSVTLSCGLVIVRELRWPDYVKTIRDLTDTVMGMLGPNNTLVVDKAKIVAAIQSQEELISYVCQKSTQMDADQIGQLSGSDMLKLLEVVIDLNLSEEVIASGKKLAGRLGAALGSNLASLKQSTP